MNKLEELMRELLKTPGVNVDVLGHDASTILNRLKEEEKKAKEKVSRRTALTAKRSDYIKDINSKERPISVNGTSFLNFDHIAKLAAIALDNDVELNKNEKWNARAMEKAKELVEEFIKFLCKRPDALDSLSKGCLAEDLGALTDTLKVFDEITGMVDKIF